MVSNYWASNVLYNILNSCPTQGRVEDEMRWSPDIVGHWIARVPADHAPSQGLMKWNEMDEMSMEKWWNEVCGRGKREKPREKPTQTPFRPPPNPHGGTETRTRDPSGERRASNRLRHEAALISVLLTGFRYFSYQVAHEAGLTPFETLHFQKNF